MFLRNFIKRGLLDAVGQQPDYWVILNAAGWLDKGVLVQQDLEEIQAAIDAKNPPETDATEPETTPPDAEDGEVNADSETDSQNRS